MQKAFFIFSARRLMERFYPLLLSAALIGCGGGSGDGSQNQTAQTPDFSLAVSPTSQTVATGKQATVSLSATPAGGFSSQVTVQVTGLPAGVSVSPTKFDLVPGTPQQVTFSAAANAAAATQQVVFTGISGSLNHAAQLSLTVNGLSAPASGRTRYIRSDATTEYFSEINSHWIIFNPPTSRFFVTDPDSNHVFVLDAVSEAEVGMISVPKAFGIGDSTDHSTLYVGTLIGDVYTIDPTTMTVTKRYPASQIGPYGFSGSIALGLSNGSIALLGAAGGIPSVDGSPSFAVWNPTANSITIYATQYGSGELYGVPYTIICGSQMGNIAGFTLTADRSKVIIGSIDSDGTLCEVDAVSGADIHGIAPGFSLNNIVTSPDGNYIVLPAYPGNVDVYDAHTLSKTSEFAVPSGVGSDSGFATTADSKTLLVPSDSDNIIYAYSLSTHQQIGWLANIYVTPMGEGFAVGPVDTPFLQAVDGTGLFAGPMEQGIGFVDSAAMKTGPVGTGFANGNLNPATGPVSGGTQTQWLQWANSEAVVADYAGVYFGARPATSVSSSSSGTITVTSPSGSAGSTDVYAFSTDGGMQLLPEAFSYGPTILQVTPEKATQEGSGTGIIYGYGFGPVDSNNIPSGLQVTVAGKPAQITGYASNAYNVQYPPFPLQAIAYTIPSGTSGSSVDIAAVSGDGEATAHAALSYLPAIQQFPLSGAALAQGIYDRYTDLYYFTDANKIQVFSKAQAAWQTPITIPPPKGATQRLWGIALSPDGTKLAIGDTSAQVIYLLSPSNPTSVQTFPVPTIPSYNGVVTNACGVAISDAGIVYYAAYVQGADDFDQFFKLDTSTGAVTAYNIQGPSTPATDVYLRTELTSDNRTVFFNVDGAVVSIDTTTDKVSYATVEPGCCYGNYELTLSSNGTRLEASDYFYDSDLGAESEYALNDREILNIEYVYGAKLSADGNLLFQPATNGVDVFDGRVGNLLTRISLPVALSPNYDALVTDGKDNVLLAITGANGDSVAVVDLTSIKEPSPLARVSKLASNSSRIANRRNARSYSTLQTRSYERTGALPPTDRRVPHVTKRTLQTPQEKSLTRSLSGR
jgi:hypothetical protein